MRRLPLCDTAVLGLVEEHVAQETSKEVGGVLVGRFADGLTHVEAALPALAAVGQATHVTFTHEVWEDILPRIDVEHPGRRIVGWYHSHPSFGIFLSEHDKFIHQNFFSDPSMVALVVDQMAGQAGWFGWEGGGIELLRTFPTMRPGLAVGSTPRRRRLDLVAAAGLAVTVAFAGGYALSGHGSASTDSRAKLQQVEAENAQLRATLAAAPVAGPVAGAAETPATTPPAPSPPAGGAVSGLLSVPVRPGDTLWDLADQLYGDGAAYTRIVSANPGLDPRRLPAETNVAVPVVVQPAGR